jgi:hypothetical protein
VQLCPPQIPHDLTRARTRTTAVGSLPLTAWSTSWSICNVSLALNAASELLSIALIIPLEPRFNVISLRFRSVTNDKSSTQFLVFHWASRTLDSVGWVPGIWQQISLYPVNRIQCAVTCRSVRIRLLGDELWKEYVSNLWQRRSLLFHVS